MGKLTHIEDVERRKAEDYEERAAAHAECEERSRAAYEREVERIEEIPRDEDLSSEEEEEFHGLDSTQPMGTGHKALIILATIVVVVAILYIVNSWIHFI